MFYANVQIDFFRFVSNLCCAHFILFKFCVMPGPRGFPGFHSLNYHQKAVINGLLVLFSYRGLIGANVLIFFEVVKLFRMQAAGKASRVSVI